MFTKTCDRVNILLGDPLPLTLGFGDALPLILGFWKSSEQVRSPEI